MVFMFVAVCFSLNTFLTAGQDTIDQTINGVDDFTTDSSFDSSNGNDDLAPVNCECVPYHQCSDQAGNFTSEGGLTLIDINLVNAPCESILKVCCSVTGDLDNPNENGDEPRQPSPSPTSQRERVGCGHRNEEGVGLKIMGDNFTYEAQFGEFPWMVAILKDEECSSDCNSSHVPDDYQCGGSLIAPQVVLTAAHCVTRKKPGELKIRAGDWDTSNNDEPLPHYDRRVRNIITHDQYYAGRLLNDVALLILDEPLEYKENIDVTCLPDQDQVFNESECFASGWGKDAFGKEGKYRPILKKVQVPIVPKSGCETALRRTRLGEHFNLHESFICAGGEKGKDTCKGDGGSPLVCPIRSKPGHYAQAGIVAWGIGCANEGNPGVYVNVAKFRNWIDDRLNQLNIDTSSYVHAP